VGIVVEALIDMVQALMIHMCHNSHVPIIKMCHDSLVAILDLALSMRCAHTRWHTPRPVHEMSMRCAHTRWHTLGAGVG